MKNNKLIRLELAFFLLPFLCVSCEFEKDNVKGRIVIMQSHPIKIPIDSMLCWWMGNDTCSFEKCDGEMKFVVFSDTATCSSCALKDMYRWDSFLQKIDCNYGTEIDVLFIFNPLPKDWKSFYLAMKTIPPSVPIYVDTLGVFVRNNMHIPSSPQFHTFLLDEEDNVLLVGNPLENKKIEDLFWQIVEEKLGKRE